MTTGARYLSISSMKVPIASSLKAGITTATEPTSTVERTTSTSRATLPALKVKGWTGISVTEVKVLFVRFSDIVRTGHARAA